MIGWTNKWIRKQYGRKRRRQIYKRIVESKKKKAYHIMGRQF
jgi:hypothetical protein